MFLRTSDGPSMPGTKRRSRPVECPSSYALIRILSEICGWRRNASVMLCVPLPPEKSTTLILERVPAGASARRAARASTTSDSTAIGPPKKRLDPGDVLNRVDTDRLFETQQPRRQHPAVPCGEWNHGQEVEF